MNKSEPFDGASLVERIAKFNPDLRDEAISFVLETFPQVKDEEERNRLVLAFCESADYSYRLGRTSATQECRQNHGVWSLVRRELLTPVDMLYLEPYARTLEELDGLLKADMAGVVVKFLGRGVEDLEVVRERLSVAERWIQPFLDPDYVRIRDGQKGMKKPPLGVPIPDDA